MTDKKWKFTTWLKRNKSALKTLAAGVGAIATDLIVAWTPVTAVGMSLKALVALLTAVGFRLVLDWIDFSLPELVKEEDDGITTI